MPLPLFAIEHLLFSNATRQSSSVATLNPPSAAITTVTFPLTGAPSYRRWFWLAAKLSVTILD